MKALPFLFLLPLCLLENCVQHQDQTTLAIRDSKNKTNLRVKQAKAKVRIYGDVAETTLELTFRNDTSRVLEADLNLPLPDGAAISRYALEVNGKMREGVIVDKTLGRMAYENTIRQKIDPGLLEKGDGNNFKTTIYPVPAKGMKTVLLSYIQPIDKGVYKLPLSFKQAVDDFHFDFKSDGRVYTELSGAFGMSLRREIKLHKENFKAKEIKLSPAISEKNNAARAFVSKSKKGEYFFYVSYPLSGQAVARKTPKRIKLIWDASYSSSKRNVREEIKLLENYLKSVSNVEVDLVVVRNQLSNAGAYRISNGEATHLIEKLKSIRPDGSTQLSNLPFKNSKYDAILLFSDGVHSGEETLPSSGNVPVFCVNTSAVGNFPWLHTLAEKSGGAVLKDGSQESREEMLKHTIEVQRVTGSGVSEAQVLYRNGRAIVVGKASSGTKKVKLSFGYGAKTTATKTVSLQKVEPTNIASLLWAQKKVDKLSLHPKENKSAIVKVAQRYNLVTDHTSLLVLDRIQDYVQYRIVPPEAKMRKDYYKRIKLTKARKKVEYANLNHVYFDWDNLKRWHQGKSPKRMTAKQQREFYRSEFDDIRNLLFSSIDTAWELDPVMSAAVPSSPEADYDLTANSMFIGGGNITNGLRSGDTAITRDSINFFLNNPSRSASSSISIQGWNPTTPYMRSLRFAHDHDARVRVYHKMKKKHGEAPGFYLDCAQFFYDKNQTELAKRILSNLAELDAHSPEMLRILATRYLQIGEYKLAEKYFRKVKTMREEEPQSYRDLAIALTHTKKYQEASNLYWEVVKRKWDSRFAKIELIALNEWNHLVAKHRRSISLKSEQRRFLYEMATDVRVVITWDTDNSDMDLWVTDPNGEKCYYGHRLTKDGGRMSRDMTGGRGPEEFMLKVAKKGTYKVEVHYYGTSQQTLIGPTTLQATFITNWGKKGEKRQHQTLRLSGKSRVVHVGDFEWK